jgi:tRNA (Thr-GGU) A37 N-methylase
LDIKPYVPKFDQRKTARIGWLKNKINGIPIISDDGRFAC